MAHLRKSRKMHGHRKRGLMFDLKACFKSPFEVAMQQAMVVLESTASILAVAETLVASTTTVSTSTSEPQCSRGSQRSECLWNTHASYGSLQNLTRCKNAFLYQVPSWLLRKGNLFLKLQLKTANIKRIWESLSVSRQFVVLLWLSLHALLQVGMRNFHLIKHAKIIPIINVERLWPST